MKTRLNNFARKIGKTCEKGYSYRLGGISQRIGEGTIEMRF